MTAVTMTPLPKAATPAKPISITKLRPSQPAATRTGLTPAGDDEHMSDQVIPINHHHHHLPSALRR